MTGQGRAIRHALARPVAWISLLWLVLITLACAFADVLAPYDPLAQDISRTLAGPSRAHWLGTDDLGRDVLSRLLHGGGLLAVALIPVAVSLAIGVPAGLAAGYGVSLSLRRGEAFGLVGESGSGKTTLALAILGLVPPPGRITSGRIVLDGEDLLLAGEARLRALRGSKLGLVSQEPMVALDPCFTVGSQLRELLRLRLDLPRRSVASTALDLLRDVGLPTPESIAGRYPHQLSGGIAQRVSIAIALSRNPRVLVADEPTTALDVTVQAEILDLLRRLQRERSMTLLLVTHDLGIVADLCDRVAVMSDGKIVETGTAETVLLHPQHPYSKKLVNATPQLLDTGDCAAPRPVEGSTK